MSNIDYKFVQNQEGVLAFQSTVDSFGIQNVTEKDISSFYVNFSSSAFLDTGLLPVDGTGLLAYRKADNHEQIVYQIKPGLYHINWGAHEGDSDAKTYYVAQPYRVVIADTLNGNLLGARTFYSPYPITSPLSELYHVNLPNINCKGYRGNCVGWICLYHSHDISKLPFNEKVAHILERCSGVETYNDANMSETDGPRFYKNFYEEKSDLSHLWNPAKWEQHSQSQGYEWTLDPELWIKVLVKDQDNQDKHYPDGQPLTIQMALLGNYQAYYDDSLIPKPVNAILRPDLDYPQNKITSIFSKSYVNSSTVNNYSPVNIYSQTVEHRQENTNTLNASYCVHCNTSISEDGDEEPYLVNNGYACETCYQENYVFIEAAEESFLIDDPQVFYDQYLDEYFHEEYFDEDEHKIHTCPTCSNKYLVTNSSIEHMNHVLYRSSHSFIKEHCVACVSTQGNYTCCSCAELLPDPNNYNVHNINGNFYCNTCYINSPPILREPFGPIAARCLCGEVYHIEDFKPLSFRFITDSGKEAYVSYSKNLYFSNHNIKDCNLYNLDEDSYEKNLKEVASIISENFYKEILFAHGLFGKMFFACESCTQNISSATLSNVNSIISNKNQTFPYHYALPFFHQSLVNCYVNVHNCSKESFENHMVNENITYSFRTDFPFR